MSAAESFELILGLMGVVLVLELAARRLGLPPSAVLVLAGVGLALMPGMPEIRLDPDLTLVLFLPPLLFSSAYFTVWRDFRANLRIILQLAIGAVAFTTLVVGAVTHWLLPTLPWGRASPSAPLCRRPTQSPPRPFCKVCRCPRA